MTTDYGSSTETKDTLELTNSCVSLSTGEGTQVLDLQH